MNKAELINALAAEVEISKMSAERFLNAFIDITTKNLTKGDPVTLIGFGNFVVSKRKQRVCRNPRTGEKMTVPAAKVVRFRVGGKLKESVDKK
jgi:DNA-binding protein HU-beta